MPVKISAIVALSDNNCIGRGNDLPWHLPDDLKRTKEITMGKPLIMGRNTYDSIAARRGGKPLPGRDSLVISRSMVQPDFDNVFVHATLEDALRHAQEIAAKKSLEELIIFGGSQIYRQALPLTDRLYLTRVHIDIPDGDAFFPDINPQEWRETAKESHITPDQIAYDYLTLERRS
ncbi:MAG: dihydrofolate reductase [Rhodospirillales bacterium]|nr:dihydrofolate reductase [Rhodospirillales bacterium]